MHEERHWISMIGMYARSKAGHDKGILYLIVGEDKESVYVCDGRTKKIEHPKRKNKKHVQPVKQYCSEGLLQRLKEGKTVQDEEIRKSIRTVEEKEGKNV